MLYQKYNNKIIVKMNSAVKIYSDLIYRKIGETSAVSGLETQEIFRSPAEVSGSWREMKKGEKWGGPEYSNIWLKCSYTVPDAAEGKKLYVFPHAEVVEALVFKNGEPSGIINSKNRDFVGSWHPVSLIADGAKAGETIDLALECYAGHYCNGWEAYSQYGTDQENYDKNAFSHVYDSIEIAYRDQLVWDFIFDTHVALSLANDLPASHVMKGRAMNALQDAYTAMVQMPDEYPEEVWHESLEKARAALAPLFTGNFEKTRGFAAVIGHSHMDTAWLWPVRETIRKCARTYANALAMMDEDPDYMFIQSSALHLDWMRRYYPSIFKRIQQRVAEGRYEPNGGVWVECDCNITGGEFMARQFLHGQRFTRKYFNYTSDCFWLPDTFGYSAAIPQIMQECDVHYFYTTKMGWNDMNRFPMETFMWKGIDGTGVITHLNCQGVFPGAKQICGAVDSMQHLDVHEGRLVAIGHGDGGGGPTPGMLAEMDRVSRVPGVPEIRYSTVSDFMKDVEENAVNLPTYRGELYLELHRGTLTQMHDIKRLNRKSEIAFRDYEAMNVMSGAARDNDSDELLEGILINQFHDILPGTAITDVYPKAYEELRAVIKKCGEKSGEFAKKLTEDDKNAVTMFNTLSFDRSGVTLLPCGELSGVSCQSVTDFDGKETVYGYIDLPQTGAKAFTKGEGLHSESVFKAEGNHLDTPYYSVDFDDAGKITSLYDRQAGREIRNPGARPLNTFLTCEDVASCYDNWEIEMDSEMKLAPDEHLVSRSVVSDGALMYVIRSEYKIGKQSSLVQDMIFYASTRQIDFKTRINWNDKHTLFKAEFDCDILANTIKNEIQFGYAERPTTRNTCFDYAKFEICNHKWSDISESRYGVAVLNDCKYGLSCLDSDIRITLHRGGTHPATTGDRGVHDVTYSLLPHTGAMSAESVIRPAYELNVQPVITEGRADLAPYIKVSAPNVILEALKPDEDGTGAVVARLYEAECTKTNCRISLPKGKTKAYLTNILEEVKEELPVSDGTVTVEFAPFRIITLMFR